MEYYWTLFNNGSSSPSSSAANALSTTLNGNCSSNTNSGHPWQSTWDPGHNFASNPATIMPSSFYNFAGKDPNYFTPDPQLTCLKLGKRHYFEDVLGERHVAAGPSSPSSVNKKGKPYYSGATESAPPRHCQVEGCGVALVNSKDYHRRHKVCETHAKAPKVWVLGIEQRFCQQCSRFHAVGEFDESKRSCRRRLAGHNERRRKGFQLDHNSLARKPYLPGRHPHGFSLNSGVGDCALSLLSSTTYINYSWNLSPSPDLAARCSAALRELIAENRASRQQSPNLQLMEDYYYKLGSGWNGGHVATLELMQTRNSELGLLSRNANGNTEPSREDGDGCSELWKLPLGMGMEME